MYLNRSCHIIGGIRKLKPDLNLSGFPILYREKIIEGDLNFIIHNYSSKVNNKSDITSRSSEDSVNNNDSLLEEPKTWGREKTIDEKDLDRNYLDKVRYRKKYSNPIERTFGIMRDDLIEYFGGKLRRFPLVTIGDSEFSKKILASAKKSQKHIFPEYCDVLIIGGGIVGASTAYHLAEKARKGLRIVMLEKDFGYSKSSTVLSVGGIRQQFSIPENIQLSQYGMQFLQDSAKHLTVEGQDLPNVNVNFQGYLTLASEEGFEQLKKNYQTQREHGAFVELLSANELNRKFPWMNTDGIEAAIYGRKREGWFDPWSFLLSMLRKAQSYGTEVINGEAIDFSVEILGDILNSTFDDSENMRQVKKVKVRLPDGEVREIQCAICVLTAGPWSGGLAKKIGMGNLSRGPLSFALPVEPRKRYVYCFESPNGPGLNSPLVVDTDGTYFRREGLADLYLCGRSPTEDEEPDHSDLSVDDTFFEEKIWPVIAKRCKSFEKLKVRSSWGGYYDYNSFDQNGIIGFHPNFSNLVMAAGFSGHGIQHAAGVGRGIMEIILHSEYKTIDLNPFSFDRIIQNKPLLETNIV